MRRSKQLIILLQLLLLVVSLFTTSWLWDKWKVDTPHGSYRWVGMDFASYWVGIRESFYGADPYSPETTLKIQEIVYGRSAALGEDPMFFSYPAWLFLLIAPLALLPYKWAAVIWVGSLLWATFNLLYKIASIMGNDNFLAQMLWLTGLFVGSLPFLVISVMKGQLGCLSLLALFAAYQTWKQKPFLAGILVGFALIKPTVTVLPVAVFLLWTLLQKNWRFLVGFAGVMSVLLASSYFAFGNWIPSYFDMLDAKVNFSVLWSVEILPAPWNILYMSPFVGILIFSFYSALKRNNTFWFPAAVLAGIALTPMRWIYDLFLGVLILAEKRNLLPIQSLLVGIAVLSPWSLVIFPEATRWNVAVVGIPLVWAVPLLSIIIHQKREREKEHVLETNA